MFRRVLFVMAVLTLLASACGGDVEEAVEDLPNPSVDRAVDGDDDGDAGDGDGNGNGDSGDDDTDTSDGDDTSNGDDDTSGSDVSADDVGPTDIIRPGAITAGEERCLIQSLLDNGISPDEVTDGEVSDAEVSVLLESVFTCMGDPTETPLFVRNFVEGFNGSSGLQISEDEGRCIIGQLPAADLVVGDVTDYFTDALTDRLDGALQRCLPDAADDLGLVPGTNYGDNAELDGLWDSCEAGEDQACNDLYGISAFGSAYEEFGATCGGRQPDAAGGLCGVGGPGVYGSDAELDALWDACEAGDGEACDNLYFESPIGSEYETFGDTCGNRIVDRETELCVDELAVLSG